MRLFQPLFLFSFLMLLGCQPAAEKDASDANKQPPNVLFIAVDDLKPELSAYGRHHIVSPNLDRLAARSMVFTNAYCNVPVCGASRASIMTGMRPHRNRFVLYSARIDNDVADATTLHGHFKENGYFTTALGKVLHYADDRAEDYSEPVWKASTGEGSERDYQTPANISLAQRPEMKDRGEPFERGSGLADTTYRDGKIAAKAIEKLSELTAKDQPFLMAVGFHKPHLPFNAPDKYWALYDDMDIQLPPNYYDAEGTPKAIFQRSGELRFYAGVPKSRALPEDYAKKLIQGYYASVSYVDAQVGKVLDALEASGAADNTIIVLWGDHGWNLGDHLIWGKHTVYNAALRVPLMISAPQKKAGRSPALVELVDLFPTLSELAGLPIPGQLAGKSMVSLLDDPDQTWKDAVFTRWKEADNITTDRYSYSEWYNNDGERYARALFDHATDSLEVNNLAERADYRSVVAELAARLPVNAHLVGAN